MACEFLEGPAGVSRTRFLAAIAVAALSMQLFPGHADLIKWVAISLGVLYLLGRASLTYPRQYRLKRRLTAQRAADEREFREYSDELAALRDRHAADPEVYESRVAALHEKHRDMLERKFGSG